MKGISSYIWQYKFKYGIAVLSLLIAVMLDLVSPRFTQHIIDDVIVDGHTEKLCIFLLGIFSVGVGRCIFQFIKEYTFDCTGSNIASAIRKDLFMHVQGLSAEFFDRNETGELMSRVKEDVDRIWDGLSYVGMLLIEVAVHTTIVLIFMFSYSIPLALIAMGAMILCACVAIIMERKLDKVYEEISEENAKLNTVAEENLAGVRTVKAFAREEFEIKKFLAHNNRYYELNMKQSKVFVKYYPYFSLITKILPLVILMVGGRFVIDNKMSLGALGAMVEYSNNIVWPMEMLGWLTNSFSSAVASNRRVKKLYQETAAVKEADNPVVLDEIKGKIAFENVSFCKADKINIIDNISFVVEPGHTLGIMGETGSGKSTIANLMSRFYDVTEGSIKIDDEDIRNMTLAQVRGSISQVMQDVFLFSDTIAENIKLGRRDSIGEKEIKRAAAKAEVSEFAERMQSGYDTVIGERGVGLSGGQKQRISIARAFSKGTPILVFDDSTSALDMETEQQIQKSLNSLDGVTKIIIAHRISSVKNADEIIVLSEGKIAERGTHRQLLDMRGLYYQTYVSQYGDEIVE